MGNKKTLYLVVIVVAAVVLAFWWWSSRGGVEAPSEVSDINQELEGLNASDIDQEFQQVDQDLNAL